MAFPPDFLQDISASATLLYSIIAASVLIYVPFGVVGYGRMQAGYDTHSPRAMFDKLPAYAQRATWAHQNAFESFAIYAAAALMAYVTGVESIWALAAAIAYVVARSLYPLFYILDIPLLRSLMFGVGSLSIGTLFVLSLLQLGI
ncbi:MAG: MAPEG family protein [Elainellaceae cyanobacterium]